MIKSLLSNESACPSESYLKGSITNDNLNYNNRLAVSPQKAVIS